MQEIRVKGASITGWLQAVDTLYEARSQDAVIAAADPELREAWAKGAIIRAVWYPIRWIRELYAATKIVLPREAALPTKLGRETTRVDMEGPLLRWLMQLAGPDLIARYAARALAGYFQGVVLTFERTPGQLSFRLREMYGMNRPQWEELLGGMAYILQVSARATVRSAIVDGGEGATAELSLRWNDRPPIVTSVSG